MQHANCVQPSETTISYEGAVDLVDGPYRVSSLNTFFLIKRHIGDRRPLLLLPSTSTLHHFTQQPQQSQANSRSGLISVRNFFSTIFVINISLNRNDLSPVSKLFETGPEGPELED
jgi:hypothetical protein